MSRRLTDEELLAKMKTHFQERKAVYDALADNLADSYAEAATDPEYVKEQSEWVGNNRVIADSGVESLQTSGSVDKTTRKPLSEREVLLDSMKETNRLLAALQYIEGTAYAEAASPSVKGFRRIYEAAYKARTGGQPRPWNE